MEELQGVELERPLAKYAAAPMRVKPLVQACYQALAFFNLLGVDVESHFWKADFVERLVDQEKASESMETVEELVDRDVAGGCVRSSGSHSRNLVRVMRGVELKRALFQLMPTIHNEPRYHAKNVQSTVTDSICAAIPVKSKTDFYRMINETDESATAEMQKYIDASTVVIRCIDELFTSRGLDTDW